MAASSIEEVNLYVVSKAFRSKGPTLFGESPLFERQTRCLCFPRRKGSSCLVWSPPSFASRLAKHRRTLFFFQADPTSSRTLSFFTPLDPAHAQRRSRIILLFPSDGDSSKLVLYTQSLAGLSGPFPSTSSSNQSQSPPSPPCLASFPSPLATSDRDSSVLLLIASRPSSPTGLNPAQD